MEYDVVMGMLRKQPDNVIHCRDADECIACYVRLPVPPRHTKEDVGSYTPVGYGYVAVTLKGATEEHDRYKVPYYTTDLAASFKLCETLLGYRTAVWLLSRLTTVISERAPSKEPKPFEIPTLLCIRTLELHEVLKND